MPRIKVDHAVVTQAGIDMGVAANTTSQVLGQVASVSQPVTAATFGEAHLGAVIDNFWTGLRQQVQLSGDVFGELGKKMGGAAVKLKNSDTTSANSIGSATNPPAATTPGPSVAAPGADNNPPPVTSAPPPADPTTPTPTAPPSGGDPTLNAPGTATGV